MYTFSDTSDSLTDVLFISQCRSQLRSDTVIISIYYPDYYLN